MKQLFFVLIFSAISMAMFSQPDTPREYDRMVKKMERKIERKEEAGKYFLSPEESIPMPSAMIQGTSWNIDYLEVLKFQAQIRMKTGKRKVLVVSFDTAGKLDHKSLEKASVPGYDFIGDGLTDYHGHGTHTCGTIASTNANIGVGAVLAEDGYLKIMPVKIFYKTGYTEDPVIIKAYEEIVDNVIDEYLEAGWAVVFTNSWGGGYTINPEFEKISKRAVAKGVIICASSGNNGGGVVSQPANSKYILAIGSIGKTGKRSYFSQYGEGLNSVAPGELILSTWPGNKEEVLQGTSMAEPHAVAVIATLLSYFPNATPAEIIQHYNKYCTDLDPGGYDIFTGYGVGVLGKLLNNTPGPVEGEDPIDDPVDDPIKYSRTMTVLLDSMDIVWDINSFSGKHKVDLELEVDMTTDLLFEKAFDDLNYFSQSYFLNFGFYFTDPLTDLGDVAKWAIHFYERSASAAKFSINVKSIKVKDENGRELYLSGEGISPSVIVSADMVPDVFDARKY